MKSKSEKMRTAQRTVALVLLLGMGLGQLVAQPLPAKKQGKGTREDDPGYVMKKSVNAEGDKLTLESYVTGESVVVQSATPTDLCLVLDVSTSMENTMPDGYTYVENTTNYTYNNTTDNTYYYKDGDNYYQVFRTTSTNSVYSPLTEAGYTYDSYGTHTYYYKDGNEYYEVSRELSYNARVSQGYSSDIVNSGNYYYRYNNNYYKLSGTTVFVNRYVLSFTVPGSPFNTTYYLTGNSPTNNQFYAAYSSSSTGTIWTGVLYDGYCRLKYTKGDATYYLTTNDSGPTTTTTAPTNVTSTTATIWTGVLYNREDVTYYRLYFTKDGTTYFLTTVDDHTAVTETPPVNVTNPADIIYRNGTLYTKQASSNTIEKYKALQDAAKTFVEIVQQQSADHPDAEGNPADHRISLVKFATGIYSNGTHNGSNVTNPGSPNLNEGNGGYEIDGRRYSYTEVVKNFRSVTNEVNVTELETAIDEMTRGNFTSSDYGLQLAVELFDETVNTAMYPDGGPKRTKVAVMFTDGMPARTGQGTDFDSGVANAAIANAKILKDAGYTVYTVGVFSASDASNANVQTYMNYVSSNYPSAQSMNNGGARASDKYFYTADDASSLSEIFKTIAQESANVEYDIDERTVVQDVISEYFKLPAGTIASDIVVKTDTCTGFNGTEPVFSGAPVTESYAVTITTYTDKDGNEYEAVQVQGFDFGTHWVGKNSENEPHGRKLIIEIPIEAKPGASEGGIHPTNLLEGSTIYPNGDTDNPFEPFPEPKYYVKKLTWIEHTIADPGESAIKLVDGVYEIYSAEGLAWFASIVCGYNGNEGNPNAKAKLMNDVDMSRYIWAPIGGWALCNNVQTLGGEDYAYTYPKTHGFSGDFDGDGHVVRNLNNDDPVSVPQAGMFGYVNAGTVKNTFVVGCDFQAVVGKTAEDGLCTGVEGHFGIIADTVCNGGVIYNCEAEGVIRTHNIAGEMYSPEEGYAGYIPMQDPTKAYIGGLVGLIGRDKTGAKSTAKVHSCISVATLAGYSMGGCVNEVGDDSDFQNSFSYPLFLSWRPAYGTDLGGLVAVNEGKIENCYLRNRANASAGGLVGPVFTGIYGAVEKAGSGKSRGTWHKGLLVGLNEGSANYIYVPEAWKECDQIDEGNDAVCFVGYDGNEASPVGWYTETETPYLYKHHDNRVTNINGTNDYLAAAPNDRLLQTLNSWVSSNTNCTKWFRTTADGINNDYPVLKIKDLQCVASDDQIVLFYGKIDPLLTDRELMTDAKAGDVICIYENAAVTETNNGTTLYINEDVAITQEEDLEAYVGITLDNSANAGGVDSDHPYYEFGEDGIDWHMFSTSLSNAPLGVEYTDATEYGFLYGHPEGMPYYRFKEEGSEENGYFPSHVYGTEYSAGNTTDDNNGVDYYHDWDYYCWDESSQHYINFKRNSASHWYESFDFNGVEHSNIPYVNETNLVPGKGYMLATATETFLQCRGTLNNGNVSNSAVTYTNNPYCVGYNLIGNPYQSYLDFDKFAAENGINTYVILDEDNGYLTYTATSTTRDDLKYINMHQGFFVKVNGATPIKFTNDMRNITASSMSFRGEDKTYPYLKLTMTEGNGMRDYATVEFNRPELGGGEKLKDLRMGNAQIYLHYDDNSYSTFFATNDVEEVPVRFATSANGTYSLNWEVSAGDFEEMYLIDNLTGNQVDMLNHSEYKFEGRSSDYASRFKVVFATVEEEEQETESENFAFEMDGNLVVNGKGSLAMYDVTGRLVYSAELTDTQSTLALPQTVGLYIVRLAGSNGVKVQKVVLK